MGQQYSSGSVTANVSGSVTTGVLAPPAGATLVFDKTSQLGAGSATVRTVTAGKTLYITSITVGCGVQATLSNNYCDLEVDIGGTYYTIARAMAVSSATGGGVSTVVGFAFNIPVPVAATKIVRITVTGANAHGTGQICGYEV